MFAKLPMYQQRGKAAFNAKLDNIKAFAQLAHHPEKTFQSIHVAGTNGKGSSSHMLASVLQEAGYGTGLYTSPHLKDFRERIKVNGNPVEEDFVVRFIADYRGFFEENGFSFFEMTVAMAFSYFSRQQVAVAVIEVGLGGRLDSTNIIVPQVALITNIGSDHMDILGDSPEKIAREKAGIIKPGVPVVISEHQQGTARVFEDIARENGSPIYFADRQEQPDYTSDLIGWYQARNIKGVLCALGLLKDFEISQHDIETGLRHVVRNTGLLGRWQRLGDNPTVICDTAHNLDGLSLVVRQLEQQRFEHLHMVLGFVKEKDLGPILDLLPKTASYYFARPNIPRGMPCDLLANTALAHGIAGKCYDTVEEAYRVALECASANDLIFIGGSTFVVAEVV